MHCFGCIIKTPNLHRDTSEDSLRCREKDSWDSDDAVRKKRIRKGSERKIYFFSFSYVDKMGTKFISYCDISFSAPVFVFSLTDNKGKTIQLSVSDTGMSFYCFPTLCYFCLHSLSMPLCWTCWGFLRPDVVEIEIWDKTVNFPEH